MATATKTEEQENPLVEGLERLPVHPTTLAIFGATGDLAHRKLLPALYNLAHEGSLPERFNLIGVSRSEKAHEDFRAEMKESIEKYSRTPPKPEVLDALLERRQVHPGRLRRPRRSTTTLRQTIAEFDEEAGIVFDRIFYLSTAPEFFPVIVKALGEHNARPDQGRGDPGGDREAVRLRPRRPRASSTQAVLSVFRGVPGLPHRPLPGQGDRPEHHGVPLRQHDVRAGLESQLHRPRADHGGRGHRDRDPRRLLRRSGRAARPRAEPHDAAAGQRVHGAADRVRRRPGARREGQGPRGDPAADDRRGAEDGRARAVRRRALGGRGGPGLSRGGRRAARLQDRDLRRAAPRGRATGAGRACPSTCARASGWRGR